MSEQLECGHDWSYSPLIMDACPDIQPKMCRKCGERGEASPAVSESGDKDYWETLKKFQRKDHV